MLNTERENIIFDTGLTKTHAGKYRQTCIM